MNDKELADAVVALGVLGWFETIDGHDGSLMTFGGVGPIATRLALRDWRVAGAMMEKIEHRTDYEVQSWWGKEQYWVAIDTKHGFLFDDFIGDESLPRAIIKATVDALQAVEK